MRAMIVSCSTEDHHSERVFPNGGGGVEARGLHSRGFHLPVPASQIVTRNRDRLSTKSLASHGL